MCSQSFQILDADFVKEGKSRKETEYKIHFQVSFPKANIYGHFIFFFAAKNENSYLLQKFYVFAPRFCNDNRATI